MGREKYVGPSGMTGKIPVVGAESKLTERKKGGAQATGERSRPAVKLAPMPKSKQPVEKTSADEPPAQKPDLRLPADIMGTGKQGTKPLAAQMRRHEKTVEEERRQRTGVKPPVARTAAEEETEKRGRGRARRGKEAPAEGEPGEDRPMLGGREQRQLARRRTAKRVDTDERPQRGAR